MNETGGDETFPTPNDEGAVRHLPGMELLGIGLESTDGTTVDLRGPGLSVVYAYPRTSPPEGKAIDGWKYPTQGDVHLSPVPSVIISLN